MDFIPLGGYKLNDEWYWLDGGKMSAGANNWQSGEPSGFKDEKLNCIGFNPTPNSHDIGYRVTQCYMPVEFFCQMDPADTSNFMLLDSHHAFAYAYIVKHAVPDAI